MMIKLMSPILFIDKVVPWYPQGICSKKPAEAQVPFKNWAVFA